MCVVYFIDNDYTKIKSAVFIHTNTICFLHVNNRLNIKSLLFVVVVCVKEQC